MGKCGYCRQTINFSLPDQQTSDLDAIIGSMHEKLGDATIRRNELPNRGSFWQTQHGLLFVPKLREGNGFLIHDDPRNTSWWNPFSRTSQPNDSQDFSTRSTNAENEIASLSPGEILQTRPGCWFSAWSQIDEIRISNRGIRIQINHQTELQVKTNFDAERLVRLWRDTSSNKSLV